MDPAAPYFGRHGVFFRKVFHLSCAFTFRTCLHFLCALAFRAYLREELLAVVVVNEQSGSGHGRPLRREHDTLPVDAYHSMR